MPNKNTLPIPRLTFYRGDLIIKQGNFGFAIYKIISGRVEVLREAGDKEIPISTLGRGEVVGEMAFLGEGKEVHSASVRALEDTEIEVWHPEMLAGEYEEMPPIIKIIADQSVRRLTRMNGLMGQLVARKQKGKVEAPSTGPQVSRRFYYRKSVDLKCLYRPVGSSPRAHRTGIIRDISLSGLQMEVSAADVRNVDHKPGAMFSIQTVLPNGKELDLKAQVISIRKDGGPGKVSVGLTFPRLTEEARKRLGFFLLPT